MSRSSEAENGNLALLRRYIADAPPKIKMQLSGINFPIGTRGDGYVICEQCASRILRRGCDLPGNPEILWHDIHNDEGHVPRCDLMEFH